MAISVVLGDWTVVLGIVLWLSPLAFLGEGGLHGKSLLVS